MEITKKEITYASRSEHFNLVGLGDIHLGNAGCDLKKLKEITDWIKSTPRTFWIGTGDYIDCINIADPRFDPYSIDPAYNIKNLSRLIPQQIEDILTYLRPIKHKCLAMVTGNHEENIRLRYNFDVGYEISKDLKSPLLGYDGWVMLQFTRKTPNQTCEKSQITTYLIYVSHGFGGARKSGAKVNRLEDVASYMDADIIILGHEHKKIIAPPIIKLTLTKEGKLCYRKQIAVMAGSFLRGYTEGATSYVERKGYSPADLGIVKIMLKPDIKDIHASI